MSSLLFPELFYQISTNLNDREKIFLVSCSKITHNFKFLLILDSEYDLKEINDKWKVKNIIIKEFSLENKIKELIKDLIPKGNEKVGTIFEDSELIMENSRYIKFVSNNINVKLFLDKDIIEKLISYNCSYLAMKIMLNNDGSSKNINKQFLRASRKSYSDIVKLLIGLGADIHAQNQAVIDASWQGSLSMVKLLIDSGADIHAQNNQAIIYASINDHLSIVELLIESGADIHAQNNQAMVCASGWGNLLVVKLLIESGADIHAQNNQAIISASWRGHLSVVKLLINSGADVHAQNNLAFKYAETFERSDVIELLKKN